MRETVKIAAALRLLLIPLLAASAYLHGGARPAIVALLVGYGGTALVWLMARQTFGPFPSVVDLAVVSACTLLTGATGSTAWLAFFLVLTVGAFEHRPAVVAALATVAVLAFLVFSTAVTSGWGVAVSSREVVDAAHLAVTGFACTVMSAVLRRHTDRLHLLLAEVMSAEERERRVLAEGLHDEPLQNLLFARHELERLRAAGDAGTWAELDEVLLTTVRQLRETVFELHPHVLREIGLRTAVEQLAQRTARRAGVRVEPVLEEVRRHPAEMLVYSTAKELLTNAVKHAAASEVRVHLRERAGELVLTVADDGLGVDFQAVRAAVGDGHIGLASVRTRLESAGGSFELVSGPQGGTRATARVPLS